MFSRKPLLLIVVSVLFCITSFSTEPPKSCLLFSITSDNMARLGIVNVENKGMTLEIMNLAGEVLFTRSVSKQKDFFKMVDLSSMPEGEYRVLLTGGEKNFEKRFVVLNHKAEIKKVIRNAEPFFNVINDEVLTVSYLNPEYHQVNIFFELNDDIVYEDRSLSGSPISKRYSLKQLPRGDYVIKLYSDGKIFSYPLAIK